MTQSDMAEAMAEIRKVDPYFSKESFVKECEFDIIPTVLEVWHACVCVCVCVCVMSVCVPACVRACVCAIAYGSNLHFITVAMSLSNCPGLLAREA